MKVKGPLMSINASGKIGERLVFSKRGSGQQARFQKAQKDVSSVDRVATRTNYANAVIAWNALTFEQKEAYKILAIGENISGYNYFVRNYLNNLPMNATGGVITYDGDYRIHTFNSDEDFVVLRGGEAEILLVAGGGSTGCQGFGYGGSGGGGGGGVLHYDNVVFSASSLPVIVGLGGASVSIPNTNGNNGGDTIFNGLTAVGGGRGGTGGADANGGDGGSGGGGAYINGSGGAGTIGQGHDGGHNYSAGGGSGGGAGQAGVAPTSAVGAKGGDGLPFNISGTLKYYGGGGGANGGYGEGAGGLGGGGNAGGYGVTGGAGVDGLGGGGGGSYAGGVVSAKGGRGVVIIRYKYQ